MKFAQVDQKKTALAHTVHFEELFSKIARYSAFDKAVEIRTIWQ